MAVRSLVRGLGIVLPVVPALVIFAALPGPLSADMIWSADERLTSSLDDSVYPAVAVDPSANVHVVWAEGPGGWNPDYKPYYKRWDGASWTPDERLSDVRYCGGPVLAADPSGSVHVVWPFRIPNYGPETGLYYKRWDGGAWTLDSLIVPVVANSSTHLPALTADTSGKVHLVWGSQASNWYEIYYKRWDGSWTDVNERLTNDIQYSAYPDVAADPSGNVHVVWTDARDGNYEIYYKRWDGVTWTTDERLTNAPDRSEHPAAAADPGGNVHVVWHDRRDGSEEDFEIYYKRWNGVTWTADERLTNAPDYSRYPAVATDPSGNVHVVWEDSRDNHIGSEIYYKRWNGVTWSVDERLTNDPGHSGWPAVAVDPSGNVHVVWHDVRDGPAEIYYKRGAPTVTGSPDVPASRRPAAMVGLSRPNPFKSTTTIAFALPTRSPTTLSIFDVGGRLVARPVNRFADAGEYEVAWDGHAMNGAKLPSGTYFYRLESAGRIVTGKTTMVE